MSKKFDKEFLELDIYNILDISIGASEKEIKKSFRKKALVCHPDKNPDNPDAAEEFNKLKKILEILLDPGARSAYDKVLKAKKAAALRTKESDLKSRKLKTDLETREKAFQNNRESNLHLSEEERLRREIKRLEEEGERLISEELESLNREAEAQIQKAFGAEKTAVNSNNQVYSRVKARWTATEDSEDYTEEEIQKLFFKWGEINAVVMQTKGVKHTALIEFKTEAGANMAVQFEKGMIGRPIEVSRSDPPKEKLQKKKKAENQGTQFGTSARDFESIYTMNQRREAERKKLIEEMLKNDL